MHKYFVLATCFIFIGCKKIEENSTSGKAYENAKARSGQDKKGKVLLRLNVPYDFK